MPCSSSCKNYNALAIDLHTMSSYSPDVVQERYSEAISETPDNLLKIYKLIQNSHKDGEKRSIELFSGDARNGILHQQNFLRVYIEKFRLEI